MKIKIKKHFKALIIVAILLIIPSMVSIPSKINPTRRWVNNFPDNYNLLRNSYNATIGYEARKNVYLIDKIVIKAMDSTLNLQEFI